MEERRTSFPIEFTFAFSSLPSHPPLITHPFIHHHNASAMGVMSIRQCYNDERLSVNWSDHRIIIAVACIVFNPTFWNIVARKGISSPFFFGLGHHERLQSHSRKETWERLRCLEHRRDRLVLYFTWQLIRIFSTRTTLEYRSKFITRMFNGNSLYGCYALAATIFVLGLTRDAA